MNLYQRVAKFFEIEEKFGRIQANTKNSLTKNVVDIGRGGLVIGIDHNESHMRDPDLRNLAIFFNRINGNPIIPAPQITSFLTPTIKVFRRSWMLFSANVAVIYR